MTDDVVIDEEVDEDAQVEAGADDGLRRWLIAVLVLALVLGVGTGGWLLGHRAGASHPSASSVDAGFARDMSTHHQQAIDMAIYERKYSTKPDLQLLAYNIEDTQAFQMGEMQGWLDSWGLSRQSSIPAMAWMGTPLSSPQQMPGLATPAQINKLETLHGKALDIMFLQLMIRHHQGGVRMARYAFEHASKSYVRLLASAMVSEQSGEIVQMEQVLRQLGGRPLPDAG